MVSAVASSITTLVLQPVVEMVVGVTPNVEADSVQPELSPMATDVADVGKVTVYAVIADPSWTKILSTCSVAASMTTTIPRHSPTETRCPRIVEVPFEQ